MTKVTEQYLDKYLELIDYFFEFIKSNKIKIRIIFIQILILVFLLVVVVILPTIGRTIIDIGVLNLKIVYLIHH